MRSFTGTAVLVALLAASTAPLAAQIAWVGAGPTFPTGDYGEYANTGFLVAGGLGFPVAEKVMVGGEAFFGQNSHNDEDEGGKTTPYGVMAGVQVSPQGADASKGVYLFGQVGVLRHRYTSDQYEGGTDSGLGFGGGAGFFFPLGGVSGWVEARILSASIDEETTRFFGVMAGVAFPVGGG